MEDSLPNAAFSRQAAACNVRNVRSTQAAAVLHAARSCEAPPEAPLRSAPGGSVPRPPGLLAVAGGVEDTEFDTVHHHRLHRPGEVCLAARADVQVEAVRLFSSPKAAHHSVHHARSLCEPVHLAQRRAAEWFNDCGGARRHADAPEREGGAWPGCALSILNAVFVFCLLPELIMNTMSR